MNPPTEKPGVQLCCGDSRSESAGEMRSLARTARLALALADQGLQSLANLALALLAAQVLSATDYGQFSTAFVVLALLTGSWRALFIEPYLIQSLEGAGDSPHAGSLSRRILLPVLACVLACLFLVLPSIDRDLAIPAALILAASLPLAVLDVRRAACLSQHRPGRAAAWTGAWCLLFAGIFAASGLIHRFDITSLAASYLLSAWLVALAGLSVPTSPGVILRLTQLGRCGIAHLVDFLLAGAIPHAVFFSLVVLSNWQEAAGLRGALVICGGLTTLVAGLRLGMLADASVHGARRSNRDRLAYLLRIAAVISLAASLLLLVTWWVATRWGSFLLGESWEYAVNAIIPFGLATVMSTFQLISVSMLRARRLPRRLLAVSLCNALTYLTLCSLGAWLGGAAGAAWGMLAASLVVAPLFIVSATRR